MVTLTIVNIGNWLWCRKKFKGANEDARIYGRSTTVHNLLFCPHTLCMNYVTNTFPGSPWFNFPAALVNSQLVSLQPVGILNSCCCSVLSFRCVSLALKSPYGERSIKYVLYCIVLKQLLCVVHGQGQKSEQKHITKKFVEFHNHLPPLSKVSKMRK